MIKYLKLLFPLLLIFTVLEVGYLFYLSKGNGNLNSFFLPAPRFPSVTPNLTPYASPVINVSATPAITLVQERSSPDDWSKILKMKTSNIVVYEAPLENIQIRKPTEDNPIELALVFNEKRNLIHSFGGRDMGIIKTYVKKNNDLEPFHYNKLKPGDVIELRITIQNGLEQEIVIIKINQ